MTTNPFAQSAARCRLEWGRRGARDAAARGNIIVIVDTLSFSTTAVTALHHGGLIVPCGEDENPNELARRVGAEVAVHRDAVPKTGKYSLSPSTYLDIPTGTRVVVTSPNGATCLRHARQVPYLFVGALVNTQAVARTVSQLLDHSESSVTVVACGERWPTLAEEGVLRMAIEDYLGAGAILSGLAHEKSPEALVCETAFKGVGAKLADTLWTCGSGLELRQRGYGEDVRHASQLNIYDTVPVMNQQRLELWCTDI